MPSVSTGRNNPQCLNEKRIPILSEAYPALEDALKAAQEKLEAYSKLGFYQGNYLQLTTGNFTDPSFPVDEDGDCLSAQGRRGYTNMYDSPFRVQIAACADPAIVGRQLEKLGKWLVESPTLMALANAPTNQVDSIVTKPCSTTDASKFILSGELECVDSTFPPPQFKVQIVWGKSASRDLMKGDISEEVLENFQEYEFSTQGEVDAFFTGVEDGDWEEYTVLSESELELIQQAQNSQTEGEG